MATGHSDWLEGAVQVRETLFVPPYGIGRET